MQGLAHYADDSSPEPEKAGPSRLRRDPIAVPSATSSSSTPTSMLDTSDGKISRSKSKLKAKAKLAGGFILPNSPSTSSSSPNLNPPPAKRARRSPPPTISSSASSTSALPENLTHTAQSDLSHSELATKSSTVKSVYQGMSDDEILRMITRPAEIDGKEEWGIPPAVDPSEASDQLKTKVENFLRLKYERGEHINTRLLSSTAFANPHIYSKLVDFVSIDERATSFPPSSSSGWLTRHALESEIELYGPAALSARQKAKEDTVKATQAQTAEGKREIKFAPPKYKEEDRKKERNGSGWDRDRGHRRERR